MKRYVQCKLEEIIPATKSVEVAWLDEALAQEGYNVRFKNQESWWTVVQRSDKIITQDQLDRLQANAHKGFASTEA